MPDSVLLLPLAAHRPLKNSLAFLSLRFAHLWNGVVNQLQLLLGTGQGPQQRGQKPSSGSAGPVGDSCRLGCKRSLKPPLSEPLFSHLYNRSNQLLDSCGLLHTGLGGRVWGHIHMFCLAYMHLCPSTRNSTCVRTHPALLFHPTPSLACASSPTQWACLNIFPVKIYALLFHC